MEWSNVNNNDNNNNNNPPRFQLDRVAFYGRTLSEYLRMFGIDDLTSWRNILDCPSGASSFVAEVKEKYGINAIGCDPLFGDDLKRLFERGEADIEYVTQRVSLAVNLYNWDFYPSIKALKEYRTQALRQFISDYPAGIIEKRYINAELPKLPFDDKSFDLVLSGHFVFTYSHKFDFSFLLSSVLELFRVSSREVRIYPLQGSDAQPYKHMTDLLSALKAYGIVYDIRPVSFEFQRGSNQMLLLARRSTKSKRCSQE